MTDSLILLLAIPDEFDFVAPPQTLKITLGILSQYIATPQGIKTYVIFNYYLFLQKYIHLEQTFSLVPSKFNLLFIVLFS